MYLCMLCATKVKLLDLHTRLLKELRMHKLTFKNNACIVFVWLCVQVFVCTPHYQNKTSGFTYTASMYVYTNFTFTSACDRA